LEVLQSQGRITNKGGEVFILIVIEGNFKGGLGYREAIIQAGKFLIDFQLGGSLGRDDQAGGSDRLGRAFGLGGGGNRLPGLESTDNGDDNQRQGYDQAGEI
jgi:hypothetical protein